jgi:hypothetical protein
METFLKLLPRGQQFLISVGIWFLVQAAFIDSGLDERLHHVGGGVVLIAMGVAWHFAVRWYLKERGERA